MSAPATPTPAAPGAAAAAGVPLPAFLREIEDTLAVHAQYVLHGNVRDHVLNPYVAERAPTTVPLVDALWWVLRRNGYSCLVIFDLVHGLSVVPADAGGVARDVIGTAPRVPSLERLRPVLARVSGTEEPPEPPSGQRERGGRDGATDPMAGRSAGPRPRVAFVLDYASRLVRAPAALEPAERDFFLFCLKLAETARRAAGPPQRPAALFNPLIWLVDSERDLPLWFAAGSQRIRSIGVPHPVLGDRQTAARGFARDLRLRGWHPDGEGEVVEEAERKLRGFVDLTDGMTLRAVREVIHLARDRDLGIDRLGDAARIYKLGVEDTPWRRGALREQIRRGEAEILRCRVLGQERALTKTLDILKRAALGLSGAQATSTGGRPRGVLFFAGPTGVGKTELAKAIAEVLFGTTDACLRFDMSEFSAEHAADRLTGAPPGYVGFEAGGELTSAVRQQPFRVVLFDEIEKAHRSVLDKFLQILEDGRLTDGQGVTTYFSECVLVFTSNLGVMLEDPQTRKKVPIVKPGTPYEELEAAMRRAIREHFTGEIGRPELLNRLGDNIVVFDFISPADAAKIFDLQLANIAERLRQEQRLVLEVDQDARQGLCAACTADLDHGGRGIGNALESALINPLARHLFDADDPPPGSVVQVSDPRTVDGIHDLKVTIVERYGQ